jgi:tRNA modification GTPase
LLAEIVRRGARLAEPGEFTARAYFNGRMDLTQAEGVAATIAAQSECELRAARQLLAGELARRLTPVMDDVAQGLALVEVGIDFSDEDVTFLSADQVRARCVAAIGVLEEILSESARFERLSHEPRIVLVGRPNAGKSTLLNALSGRARAVVSNVAGTTRDAIWAEVRLARGLVRVVDVAGVEEVGSGQGAVGSAEESIARQMREQAMRAVGEADLVVFVVDAVGNSEEIALPREMDLVVRTKVDLVAGEKTKDEGRQECLPHLKTLRVSAKTGVGMAKLRARLDELAFGLSTGGSGLALNARHVRTIGEAREALTRAVESVEGGAEVVAMELREGLEALGAVLGRMSPDDLLGRIFSGFCIGK